MNKNHFFRYILVYVGCLMTTAIFCAHDISIGDFLDSDTWKFYYKIEHFTGTNKPPIGTYLNPDTNAIWKYFFDNSFYYQDYKNLLPKLMNLDESMWSGDAEKKYSNRLFARIADDFKTIWMNSECIKVIDKLKTDNPGVSGFTQWYLISNRFWGSKIGWCACNEAPPDKRFFLLCLLLDHVLAKFPDRSTTLVYTSFCSGNLFQDFFALRWLIKLGYKNIIMNFIDRDYKQDFQALQLSFDVLLKHCIEKQKETDPLYNLVYSVRYWIDANDYIKAVQNGSAEKGNILTMVDYGQGCLSYKEKENYLSGQCPLASGVSWRNSDSSINHIIDIPFNGNVQSILTNHSDAQISERLIKIVAQHKGLDRQQLITKLITNYADDIANARCSVAISACRIFEQLIEETAQQNRVILQLSKGKITDGSWWNDLMYEGFKEIKVIRDELAVKLNALKNQLLNLKNSLDRLKKQLEKLQERLG